MKTLLERRDRDERSARWRSRCSCYQARKQVGAFAAALGGLDTLVFTGGIGERAAPVRAEICDGLGHLGVRLDPARNAAHASPASAPGSGCQVRIVAHPGGSDDRAAHPGGPVPRRREETP